MTVEEYLASLPEEQRTVLNALRATILAAIPGATEVMSYGVPTFKLGKRSVVSFGAAKNHCALYVMSPAVVDVHSAELAGWDTGKGTVRFRPDRPLPRELVVRIVQARIAENPTPTATKRSQNV